MLLFPEVTSIDQEDSPTPEIIASRNATINPKNISDYQCFMRAVLASLHKGEIHAYPERKSVFRKFTDNYDWSDITFPIQPKDIRLWESKNKIRVNILGYDVPEIYIMKNDDLSEYTQTLVFS